MRDDIQVSVWPALDGTWCYRVFVFRPGEGNSLTLRGYDRPTKRDAINDAAEVARGCVR